MRKKELAAGLGISVQMVDRLGKRGMPTNSLEAATRWRTANLDPCRTKTYRADGNTGVRPVRQTRQPRSGKSANLQSYPPDGRQPSPSPAPNGFDPDHFEREVLPKLAVMFGDEALAVVTALGKYAALLLAEGKFEEVRETLQSALRAVPKDRRDDLQINVKGTRFETMDFHAPATPYTIPADVWEELMKDLIVRCQSDKGPMTPEESAHAETGGDAAYSAAMYAFAAGEWTFGPA